MAVAILSACASCGKAVKSSRKKYCGTECYRVAQRAGAYAQPIENSVHAKACDQCGTLTAREFAIKRNGERSSKAFCSRTCYDLYRANQRSGCAQCGLKVRLITDKYCSQACKVAHNKPAPCTCKNCLSIFTAIKYVKKADGGLRIVAYSSAQTCSPKCHNDWIRNDPERKRKISAAFTGDKHPAWQGGSHREGFRGHDWERLSESIRDRAGRCCEHCGMPEEEHLVRHRQRLNVNHKTPFHQHLRKSVANKAGNLEALCKSCHTKADWIWRKAHPIQASLNFR